MTEPSKRHSLADHFSAAQLKSPVSYVDLCRAYDTLAVMMLRTAHEHVAAINQLTERLSQLEGKALSYQGIWQDQPYDKNSLVTVNGAMWLSVRTVKQGERPGQPGSGWKLSAKSH